MKYIKQIQSFLIRKNIRVTQPEIKRVMTEMGIDIDNPTQEQITQVKEHFMKQSEALSINTQNPELSGLIQQHTQESEDTPASYPVDDNKRQMVVFKSQQMGLSLAASEIEVIASRVDTSSSSFIQTVNDIENALIAYIDYQASLEKSTIDSMMINVTNRLVEKNQQVRGKLNTGIDNISSVLEVADQQLKSETERILNRLRIPN